KPTVYQCLFCLFFSIPISFHYLWTSNCYFSRFSNRQFFKCSLFNNHCFCIWPWYSNTTANSFFPKKVSMSTGDDSVNAYPSTNLPLVTFSNCCCTSTGSGAEPLIHALIEDKSYFSKSGWFNKPI